MLWSRGSQRVGHDSESEWQFHTELEEVLPTHLGFSAGPARKQT